jgi:flavin-dependent dehydrogenase
LILFYSLKNIIVIGGGLGGLITAIRLVREGFTCTVCEKRAYPFHRVCGEYVSLETLPFLQSQGLFPGVFNPPRIHRFQLTSVSGESAILPLTLGGFGISRYAFDEFLARKARAEGVQVMEDCEVLQVTYRGDDFEVHTSRGAMTAQVVVGAYGKRSRLDRMLNRRFIRNRSPFVGVKYHVRTDFPDDLIALHNFHGGYCGISRVENDITNLCYLIHRDVVRQYGSLSEAEKKVLCANPWLKRIFAESDFLFSKPEVINEISFEMREPVWNHMIMVGDTAGLITPLCGNGMAMAIHAGKMAAAWIATYLREGKPRSWLEDQYARQWRKTFSLRLRAGRFMQHYLFGSDFTSQMAVQMALNIPVLARTLIRISHGKPF